MGIPVHANLNMSSRTIIDITKTSPQDWHYVSEGGATIVLSYIGPRNSELGSLLSWKVLRLRKRSHRLARCYADHPLESEGDDPQLAFQDRVIARLVPSEFLPELVSVSVDEPWLREIATFCEQSRPLERQEKDCIDITKRRAVLATDLIRNECLVVEIKPKWSFLPSPTHVSPANRSVKMNTCRFCMHSYLKSSNRLEETPPAGYCPLDLFSGDEIRITRATRALFQTWVYTQGSANNLKIFSQGKLLKPGDPEIYSIAAGKLSQIVGVHESDLSENFIRAVVPILTKTSVLQILSKFQRTLDPLDIEGLSQLYRKTQDESSSVQPLFSNLSEPSISDWEAFLDTYRSSHHTLDHSNPLPSNLHYYIMAYLLSATFKDCSIMIGLSCSSNPITLIDLDPKSVIKLPEWEKLDKRIVEAYAGVEGRQCIDTSKPIDKI